MVPEAELNLRTPQPDFLPPEPPQLTDWQAPVSDPVGGARGYEAYPPTIDPSAGRLAAARSESLPVEPRPYHQFYRAPAFRWWKPLAAVGLFVALYLAVAFVFVVIPVVIWFVVAAVNGQPVPQEAKDFDPAFLFIVNNISIALAVPAAFFTHWIVFRQRPRWLSSVVGGFRWRPFWRLLAVAAVVLVVATAVQALLTGGLGEVTWTGSSLVLIVAIVVTTPFQCAAEEYVLRGLLMRSIGSWFSRPGLGLAVGMVITSVIFMFLHGAGDPWLNSFYLLFAALATILVWRSGGLEAAVALHVANNVIAEALLPFQPDQLTGIFDRQAGVADASTLIQMGVVVLVAGLLLWQSSRLGMVRTAAPAAVTQV